MSDIYKSIFGIYDSVNGEINYGAWADFVEKCFDRFMESRPSLVLDLACGTGKMTLELAKRGYDMIGVDISEDMLSVAYDNMCSSEKRNKILYLCQDMRAFELYGTVGAVTCCLDGINYLLDRKELEKCFLCVHNYLDPGGLFLFDVNTPYKFENVYADNAYVLESEDDKGLMSFCGWQNEYDKETRVCNFYLTVFTEKKDGLYTRKDEVQSERCYDKKEIGNLLSECGFECLGFFGDFDFCEPDRDCQRWYIAAKALK